MMPTGCGLYAAADERLQILRVKGGSMQLPRFYLDTENKTRYNRTHVLA